MNTTTRILTILSIFICTWFFVSDGKDSFNFYGDGMGYYMYLPTTFIYHTHKALDWLPEDKHFDNSIRNYLKSIRKENVWTPKGYLINKYTYGVAAMELPFFAIAHAYEKLTGGEANGYSTSYRNMVKVSSLFYALMGLLVLYHVLIRFTDKDTAVRTLLVLLVGTNFFWFTLHQAGMAHIPLFFLYGLLLWLTIRIHERPSWAVFAVTGMCLGLITVIRPTDIIAILIPLLYNVYDRNSFREKLAFMKAHIPGILLAGIMFLIPVLPQLLYWKMLSGSFLYYSYGNESFHWTHPRILEGLFSFGNGWLIYSPVMIFSLIGIVFYRRVRPVFWLMLTLVPVYIYIIYSWHVYNYINGLGSRPMIHLYPLLAIPLAAFIRFLSERSIAVRSLVLSLFFFFISLNISYSLQRARGLLTSEEANAVYNMNMLFRLHATYSDIVTWDIQQVQPKSDRIEKVAILACNNYDDAASPHFEPDSTGHTGFVYHMAADEEYHPGKLIVDYDEKKFKGAMWLKCSGRFMCPQAYQYFKHLLTMDILRDGKSAYWYGLKIDNKIGLADKHLPPQEYTLDHMETGTWGYVYCFIKIPDDMQKGDQIRLDVWNIGRQPLYMDDICLELYRDK